MENQKWDSAGERFWEISPGWGRFESLPLRYIYLKKEKGDFGINYSLGTVTPGLP